MVKLEDATNWQQISGEVKRARGAQRLFSEENRWQRRLEFSLVPRAGDQHTRSGIFCILLDYLHCTVDAEFQNIRILVGCMYVGCI